MTPYRTQALRATKPRPGVPFARVVLWCAREAPTLWALIFGSPYGWRWIRRAIGGAWEQRCYLHLPGAPEVWMRHGDMGGPQFSMIVDREAWP